MTVRLTVEHANVLLDGLVAIEVLPETNPLATPWTSYETDPDDPKSTADGWKRLAAEARAFLETLIERDTGAVQQP